MPPTGRCSSPSGLELEALRQSPGGVRVDHETRYRKYAGGNGQAPGFATPSRKVEVFSERLLAAGQAPLPDYVEPAIGPVSRADLTADFPLVLTSAKSLHYCHSQHRGMPSLRRREPDPTVEMHPEAAAARSIENGDWVRLTTPHGAARARAAFKPSLDPRVVSATHGWWQACAALDLPGHDATSADGANVNAVIGNQDTDPISGSVPHRSYLCEVTRIAGAS